MWRYLFFIVVILSLLFNMYDSLSFDLKTFSQLNTKGSYYNTILFFFISGTFFYMCFFEYEYEFKFDKYILLVFSFNVFLQFLYELSYFITRFRYCIICKNVNFYRVWNFLLKRIAAST